LSCAGADGGGSEDKAQRSAQRTLPRVAPGITQRLTAIDQRDVERVTERDDVLTLEPIKTVIRNDGAEAVDWEVSVDQPWLVVPANWRGAIGSGSLACIEVAFDRDQIRGLTCGAHMAQLTLQAVAPGSDVQLDEPVTRAVVVTVLPSASDKDPVATRQEMGAIALYDFEVPGERVNDVSLTEPLLPLRIEDAEAVTWLQGRLRIDRPTRLVSMESAAKIARECEASNALTVEAWITPSAAFQVGPARIVTISKGNHQRSVTLGQGLSGDLADEVYNTRLRTTTTDANGMPHLATKSGSALARTQHVVFTRARDGVACMYVDGLLSSSATIGGALEGWDPSFRLALGNELGESRSWLGALHLVAMYPRALSASEVERLASLGPGDRQTGMLAVSPGAETSAQALRTESPIPTQFEYALRNVGTEAIEWRVTSSQDWATVAPDSGSLAPEQVATCLVQWNEETGKLGVGSHTTRLTFENLTNRLGDTTATVRLSITDPAALPPHDDQRPGAHNTGPSHPDLLQPSGSITVTEDGAIIENVIVRGMIDVLADNVTIRNFIIAGAGTTTYGIRAMAGKTGIVIEDGEVRRCKSAGLFGRGFTARRLNIHEMLRDGMKLEGDNLIEACWIHHLGTAEEAHADGNQTTTGHNIVLRGNYFEMPTGVAGYKTNATAFQRTDMGPISNFIIDSNWLDGGNYTVYFRGDAGGHSVTDCQLINNRFGRNYRYGVLSIVGSVHNLTITGNVWDDTGELMSINR